MSLFPLEEVRLAPGHVSRRSFLRYVSAGAMAAGTLNFHELMTVRADELRKAGRALILLWMQGGPSQFETFDPKPGVENGGPTQAISTATPGIQIANGWEHTAKVMQDVALVRSMTNKEGQHQRATFQMHTGYIPSGSVRYPSLGCAIAKELNAEQRDLPCVVSVGPTQGAGFLGVDYDPFVVQNAGQMPRNVTTPVATSRFQKRLGLLSRLEDDFAGRGADVAVRDHQILYKRSAQLVMSPEVKAFDISHESEATRQKYGDSEFGRGCLLARRLVEAGVTFVEVRSSKRWDTHKDNFESVKANAAETDPGMAALISDLKDRGMLERTLVVWMGEFGRTPKINPNVGRDHYPRVFNAALAGGGIRGGQVIGASTADGTSVKDDPVTVPDMLSTICQALHVDPRHENVSPQGRPIKLVDGGKPVEKLFG